MTTQGIISVLVALVVVGGGAWYLSTHQSATVATETQQTTGDTGSSTFAQFIAQGGSRSCDVTVSNPDAPASGVVFVNGNQVRADFTAKPTGLKGGSVNAHVIQTDGYVYSWTDLIPQGVKVAVAGSMGAAASQGFDVNAQVSYDCSPWVPDANKFVVPSTVTFMEVKAQGQGTAGTPN